MASLKNIAEKANVSVGTVSKAFSDSREISVKTKEKILDIAKEMGVYDKYYKGKYSRKIIAVIVPEVKSQRYYSLISEFNDIFYEKDCTVVVSVTNFDDNIQKELIRYYSTFDHSDGIILAGAPKDIDFAIDVPLIVLADSNSFDCVYHDSSDAINDAVKHLKDNGHTDIAFIGERKTTTKFNLFKEALRKNRLCLNNDLVITSDMRFEQAGYTAMNKLFDRGGSLPTAIVAAYDYIALGIYRSIYEHGYSIPDDFSIIGMDNIDVIENINPPMTSIGSDPKELCTVTAELMMKRIENRYFSRAQHIKINDKLVIRQSVKKIN